MESISSVTIEPEIHFLILTLEGYSAVFAGADRIELCGNLSLGGGTTPSVGLLKAVQKAVPDTPIMVMIRPRTGDFLYSPAELEVMAEDIQTFKQLGVSGVVIGVLKHDGTVDVDHTKLLVDSARPLEVTFHRAFDMTTDASQALATVASIPGISRILTSGRGKTAPSSLSTLETIFHERTTLCRPPTIIPGSGINPRTVRSVLDALLPLGLQEIHLSGGHWVDGGMSYRRVNMGMGIGGEGEWGVWMTNGQTIKEVRSIADVAMIEYRRSLESSLV